MRLIASVRGNLKKILERLPNEQLKLNFLQALPFWIASLATGIIAVFYAQIFSLAERVNRYIAQNLDWWIFLLTPFCFLVSWYIVKSFAPFARGSGIPQVMASIELATPKQQDKVDRLLNVKIILVKIISSAIAVMGGGVIGREGPTIQIAGSVFRFINKILPSWWPKISKQNMIMAGAASGLAAAFNTPLGGIVFAVEELTRRHISFFKTALFSAVIVAGLTAQALLGPYLYLGYPQITGFSYSIFLWIMLVSVLAGFGGSIMSKLILKLLKWVAGFKLTWHRVGYIILCGLIIAATSFFISEKAVGSGKEIMTETLFTNNKHLPWYYPFLRIEGLIISFTTGGAGGVFAPSLSAGASIGSVLAGILDLNVSESNLLILSGMVAFLTGVTRTPFTSAILVLEMTDRHNVIFHLMLAGMLSSLASLLIDRRSFYDHLKVQYLKEIDEQVEQNPVSRGRD
jgi:H+/Cl- antiporter ClcA